MNKALCRICQGFLKIAMYLLPWKTPQLIEGVNALENLPALIQKENIQRIMFVASGTLLSQGKLDGLFHQLKEDGIFYTIYSGIHPDPTEKDVLEGLKHLTENQCQAMAAVGGGSPIDCCKAIAAMAAKKGKTIAQLQGLFRIRKKVLPIFAIPTTSGTGSETTIAAVITDTATHHKASITDLCLLPRAAILDPLLTQSLSPKQTAYGGMDALCHAVEAYTNHTYNTALENRLAEKAVSLIYQNLYPAYVDGNDLSARQNMQKAAFYAGRSFTRGCVGYVHAIGHALGSLYSIPHGLAMAVILPHVLRQYGPAVYKTLAPLAEICGLEGACAKEKAEAFIGWIETVNEKMGIPSSFPQIQEKDIPQIIAWALKEANPLYPVPVVWDSADLQRCIQTIKSPVKSYDKMF